MLQTISTLTLASDPAGQTPDLPEKVKKAGWDPGQSQLRMSYRTLRKFHEPFPELRSMLQLSITLEDLDLSLDAPQDGCVRFIEPVPRAEMAKFVKRNRPWRENPLDRFRDNEILRIPQDRCQGTFIEDAVFHEGGNVLVALQAFCQTPLVDDDSQWYNKAWICQISDWYPLRHQYAKDFRMWTIDSVLEPDDEVNPQSFPHAQAFVHSSAPLQADWLSTGEMVAATDLITARRCYQGYNSHRYIPAIIFYASFRQLRVLQVWHDKNEPATIHVRKSPIMDFMRGERANRREWINVLCWMMGDPVIEDVSNASAEKVAYASKQWTA